MRRGADDARPPSGPAGAKAKAGSRPPGIALIVAYKLGKALTELALVVSILVVGPGSVAGRAREAAVFIRHHAVAAWSTALAARLVGAATERHARVLTLALLLDGLFTCLEGWALHRRYGWGRWLVIAATACLLPFEVVALARHQSASRLGLLLLNVLIVGYLVRRKDAFAK